MTEPEILVPEGSDAIDDLTIRELDLIARLIKCDVMQALSGRGAEGVNRQAALARIAQLWAKKRDPQAKLDQFLDMKSATLSTVLGFDREDDQEQVPGVPPTTPASESE